MKNINVCLLAAVACTYSIQATANSLEHNLNFVIEDNVYSLHNSSAASHTVTPLELKPMLISNSGVKLAAVCALGSGGCDGLGFGTGNNNINLDNEALCREDGFGLTGNCPTGSTKDNLCPYNEAFFKSCTCDTSHFTQSGTYTGQCGSLADVNTCSDSSENKYYRCDCDTSMVTKCNFANQYTVAGAEFCKDSQSGDYIANTSCKSCNTPAIVNATKNGCTCPSTYTACGTNQNGLGTPCTADGGNKYTSCECPAAWSECNSANSEVGTGLSCTINGVTKFESCGCPTGWVECGANQEGVGSGCTKDGVTKYASCKCSSSYSWSTCSGASKAVGAKECILNGTTYFSGCKAATCEANIIANHPSMTIIKTYPELMSNSMSGKEVIVLNDISDGLNKIYIGNGTKIYSADAFNDELCAETKLNLKQVEFTQSSTLNIPLSATEMIFAGSDLNFSRKIDSENVNFSNGNSSINTTNDSRLHTNILTSTASGGISVKNLSAETVNIKSGIMNLSGNGSIVNFNIYAGSTININGGTYSIPKLNAGGTTGYAKTIINFNGANINSIDWSIGYAISGTTADGLNIDMNLDNGTVVTFSDPNKYCDIDYDGRDADKSPTEFIITLKNGSVIKDLGQIIMRGAYGMKIVLAAGSNSYVAMRPPYGYPETKMEARNAAAATTFQISAHMSGAFDTGQMFYTVGSKTGMCDGNYSRAICYNMRNTSDKVEPFCTFTQKTKGKYETCQTCERSGTKYGNCTTDCNKQYQGMIDECYYQYSQCRDRNCWPNYNYNCDYSCNSEHNYCKQNAEYVQEYCNG